MPPKEVDLREAIKALAEGRFVHVHQRDLVSALAPQGTLRLLPPRTQDDVQGYSAWLVENPDRGLRDLLAAPPGKLRSYLKTSFFRFLFEAGRGDAQGKVQRALDPVLRADGRFRLAPGSVSLSDETGAAKWPPTIWRKDTDRFETRALADAAHAALAESRVRVSRAELARIVLERYSDGLAVDPKQTDEEEFHRDSSYRQPGQRYGDSGEDEISRRLDAWKWAVALRGELNPRERLIFDSVLRGEKAATIAERLGTGPAAVYDSCQKVKERVREILRRYRGQGLGWDTADSMLEKLLKVRFWETRLSAK